MSICLRRVLTSCFRSRPSLQLQLQPLTATGRPCSFRPLRPPLSTTQPIVKHLTTVRSYSTVMDSKDLIDYLADSPSTIVNLPIKKHFEALSDKEQRYAHFISKAAWAGTRIILRQVSPESESIFDFILALHKSASGDWSSLKTIAGISDEDFKQFFEYTTQFLGNSGNYKSFGDSKFVPRCEEKVFKALAATSPEAEKYYEATKGAIFSSNNLGIMHLGYPEEGHLTNYYPASKGITKAEIEAVGVWMGEKGLLAVRVLSLRILSSLYLTVRIWT